MASDVVSLVLEQSVSSKSWFRTRYFVAFMLFFGTACAHMMRTNMNVMLVVMVNHTSLPHVRILEVSECGFEKANASKDGHHEKQIDGPYVWTTEMQGFIISVFYIGYCIVQIPSGIMAKKYGAKNLISGGMLLCSLCELLVPIAAHCGTAVLLVLRFTQGIGESTVVPCTHSLIAKWILPNERGRIAAIVYAGAQFGTMVSMPLSAVLSDIDLLGGWKVTFYFYGVMGIFWSGLLYGFIYEDPNFHPTIDEEEKKEIMKSIWGDNGVSSPPIPWLAILKSLPFWAVLVAHVGQNYGYETLLTGLPTYMNQVLGFDIEVNGVLSALPYLVMWAFSITSSWVADSMISNKKFSHTSIRKFSQFVGHLGPAVAMIGISFTGCSPALTVTILTIGVGLNGSIYSGFKVNHFDISPRLAGLLMSLTNFAANMAGFMAPLVTSFIINDRQNQESWREVFMLTATVYFLSTGFYIVLGSSEQASWDNPSTDNPAPQESAEETHL